MTASLDVILHCSFSCIKVKRMFPLIAAREVGTEERQPATRRKRKAWREGGKSRPMRRSDFIVRRGGCSWGGREKTTSTLVIDSTQTFFLQLVFSSSLLLLLLRVLLSDSYRKQILVLGIWSCNRMVSASVLVTLSLAIFGIGLQPSVREELTRTKRSVSHWQKVAAYELLFAGYFRSV